MPTRPARPERVSPRSVRRARIRRPSWSSRWTAAAPWPAVPLRRPGPRRGRAAGVGVGSPGTRPCPVVAAMNDPLAGVPASADGDVDRPGLRAVFAREVWQNLIAANARDDVRIGAHVRPDDVVAAGLDERLEPANDLLAGAGHAEGGQERVVLDEERALLDDARILDERVGLRDQQPAVHARAFQRLLHARVVGGADPGGPEALRRPPAGLAGPSLERRGEDIVMDGWRHADRHVTIREPARIGRHLRATGGADDRDAPVRLLIEVEERVEVAALVAEVIRLLPGAANEADRLDQPVDPLAQRWPDACGRLLVHRLPGPHAESGPARVQQLEGRHLDRHVDGLVPGLDPELAARRRVPEELAFVRPDQVVLRDHRPLVARDAVADLDVEVREAAVEDGHEVAHLGLAPTRLRHGDVLEIDVVGVVGEDGLEIAPTQVGDLVKDSLARVLHRAQPPAIRAGAPRRLRRSSARRSR